MGQQRGEEPRAVARHDGRQWDRSQKFVSSTATTAGMVSTASRAS
jgi:hypothetical protein